VRPFTSRARGANAALKQGDRWKFKNHRYASTGEPMEEKVSRHVNWENKGTKLREKAFVYETSPSGA